jgi:hypothetical protein
MIHLTPELLRRAYALLRETAPFHRWKLPEPALVKFGVLRTKSMYGDHRMLEGVHVVRVSAAKHDRIGSVLYTLAHEMVHMRLMEAGARDSSDHGTKFQRLASQVCKHHPEFDRAAF